MFDCRNQSSLFARTGLGGLWNIKHSIIINVPLHLRAGPSVLQICSPTPASEVTHDDAQNFLMQLIDELD
ncbi:Uncharacterized protein HZ326_10670 [Fusarium oxysporum f. sp. albedinis]|nr:Uncharacterized protein HZ326_10670 [Fusarium oxysporum f. sp. albedinis]